MITATNQRYLSSQTKKSFHHYLFTVHWDHLLIQLNQIICVYEKTISQLNSLNSVTNGKWNTNTEIAMKSTILGPTHNISEVSGKVYLSNADKVLRKEILKPCPIATCNLIHKAAEIPQVKVDIFKPTNNQPSALSPNVIGTSCLNTRK